MWCLEVIKKINEPPSLEKKCDLCLKQSANTHVIVTATLGGIVLW